VRQLGDRDFRVRESASQALLRLGEKSLAALEAGMQDPDPEIRRRCRELHQQVLRLGLEERIKRFLTAKDNSPDSSLPGWKRFAELVGNDDSARRFYAEMVRHGYDLLLRVERAAESQDEQLQRQAQEALAQFLGGMYQTVFNNNTGVAGTVAPESFALALFLMSYPILRDNRVQFSRYAYPMCHQQNIRQTLMANDDTGRVLRRLVAGWISAETDAAVQMQGMQLALSFDLPELFPVAKRLAANAQIPGYTRAQALSVVAKYGGKKEISFLERFLDDKSHVTTYHVSKDNKPVVYKTEIRDWALALLIHLTGQPLRDYPFPVLQVMRVAGNLDPVRSYTPYYFGFSDASEREVVFKKWQQWRVEHPLP
jgi:hypothetical protein